MPGYYEIVGADEDLTDLRLVESILGREAMLMGEDYLLGAAPRRMSARRQVPARRPNPVQAAVAARRAREGVIVREAAPSTGGETVMGMASAAAIAAGVAGNATSTPQELFRPTKFTVPASVAPNFLLTDLRIGVKSQFVSVDPIPCEALQEAADGMRLKLETAQVNNTVVANVTNIGAAALFFRACVHGTVAR